MDRLTTRLMPAPDLPHRCVHLEGPSHPAPASKVSYQSITAGLDVTFAHIPHRQFLYGVELSRGENTVLAAPGGTGKSSYAIGVAVSLASNNALLGDRIWAEKPKVLYINGEDSTVENIRRIWSFCLKHGLSSQNIQNLLLVGADDWRAQKLSFLCVERGSSVHVGLYARAEFVAYLKVIVTESPPQSITVGGRKALPALMFDGCRSLDHKPQLCH
jgi:hypothetical protein